MEQKQEIKANYPIRERFLKEFVARLISQGYAKEVTITKVMESLKGIQGWNEPRRLIPVRVTQRRLPSIPNPATQLPLIPPAQQMMPQQIQQPQQPQPPAQQTVKQQESYFPFQSQPQKPLYILKPLSATNPQQTQRVNPPPRQMPPPRAMAPTREYTPSIASQRELVLSRILPILNDPTVFSIECSGPDKPVLVNRYGSIQASQITLSAEDIKSVLQEISNRTRIPLITGAFKAAFDNFICTAVVSDFISSRFIIQRKPNPMMQPGFR